MRKLVAGFVVLAALFAWRSAWSAQFPDAGGRHVCPGVAGRRVLAAGVRLRAAGRRCADAAANSGPGRASRILAAGRRRRRRCCCGPGAWNDLSILKEYANRADAFWQRGGHASGAGLRLARRRGASSACRSASSAIACRPLRAAVLNVLNIVQTIPSIALFGLLIAPLAWVAANIPGACGDRHFRHRRRRRPWWRCSPIRCCRWSPIPLSGSQGVPPAAIDAARAWA